MSVKLSIIIPVYNVELYISKCLDSVISQLTDDMEVICVNDGSTDNSGKILEEYENADNRIRVINQLNKGQSASRNTGLKVANGKYICFVDSDDYIKDGALLYIIDIMKNYSLDVFLYDAECIYETEKLKEECYKDFYYTRSKSYKNIVSGKQMLSDLMDNNDICDSVWLMCIDNDFLKRYNIKFKEGVVYEDSLFYFECLYYADYVMHCNINLYVYRVRDNSTMTSNASFHKYISRLKIIEALFSYLYKENFNELDRKIIITYLAMHIYGANCLYEALKKVDNYFEVPNNLQIYEYIFGLGKYGLMNFNNELYMEGFLELIEKQREVIIYGTGDIGNVVYNFLKKRNYNKKIKCFAVSEKSISDEIDGIPIWEIDNLQVDDDTLFIIATCDKYWNEIEDILHKHGYYRCKKIDIFIEKCMRNELSGC